MRASLCAGSLIVVPFLCTAQQMPTWSSIVAGNVAAIETYVQEGGDPNASVQSSTGEPVRMLKVALFDREQDVALALLRGGADFDSLDDVGLIVVVREGMTDVFEFLIQQRPGRLREAITADPVALLRTAAARGYSDMLHALLAAAEQQNIVWSPEVLAGATATAISFHHNDIARELLRFGAGPTGMVLRVAARDGSPGMVRTLLRYGVDPESMLPEADVDPAVRGRTAMEYAWNRYNSSPDEREPARLVAIELMDAGGANEDATTGQRLFNEDLLEFEAITDASARLLHAARYGYLEEVLSLVRQPGMNADTLHEAATIALQHLQNDVAAALIDSGITVDDGLLHAAASGNSPGIVRRLVALGADPNAVVDERTPVESWWARPQTRDIGIGGDYVLHELIDAGASVDWLCGHQSRLNPAARTLLRSGGENCASAQ